VAAPEHVPVKPGQQVRTYGSPPRRSDSWLPDRPADLLGSPGPDQGYALKLARLVEPELCLAEGEHARDALAGIVAIGLKRASLHGRAPVIHDLRVAATLFGYLDPAADPVLVRLRRELFEEVGHFHHYTELRGIVDLVPADVLRQSPEQVADRYAASWRDQLVLDVA
jgi:hypothetical protein